LNDVLASAAGTGVPMSVEEAVSELPLASPTDEPARPVEAVAGRARSPRADAARPPSEELLGAVREILGRELVEPHTDSEVARLLAITRPQARAWLSELVGRGVLEELPDPARYRSVRT
jgi:hypothetical protein